MPPNSWINTVAGAALGQFESVMDWLGLGGGKKQGKEYLPLNPRRSDNKPGSFSISRETGAWMDGASGDRGGDLVALAAFVLDVRMIEAADRLGAYLGLTVPPRRQRGKEGDSGTGQGMAPPPTTKPASGPAKAPSEAGEGESNTPQPVCVMPVPDDAPPPPASHARHGKPAGRWAYRDAAGRVNFYHDRYEPKGERKQFSPLTLWRLPDGALAWQFKAPPAPRPLLGCDDLAARPVAPVVVVEGEKARDAAMQLLPEAVVVCWQGGAQAVERADWAPLQGRKVTLWPDFDEAGAGCMAKLSALLPALPGGGVAKLWQVLPEKLALTPQQGEDGSPILAEGPALEVGDDAADLLGRGWAAAHLALLFRQKGWLKPIPVQIPTPGKKPDTAAPAKPSASKGGGEAPLGRRFELLQGGVYLLEPERSPRFVCAPLEVLARTRDPHNHGWGLLVSFADPDGKPHKEVIPARAFKGDGLEVAELLLDRGLTIAPRCRPQLVEYLQTSKPDSRARITSRTGWHQISAATGEDAAVFVLPEQAFGQGGDAWIYESETPAAHAFKVKGTLAGWREDVAGRCAGNSRLVFSVAVAFASPLLYLLGAESGGFHFRSNSSDGKTTCLRVAGSVCGSPEYMQRWRATDNGLEALAMQHCDAPLLLDEIAQLDPKAAGEVAYMLANGTGKTRAGRTGGMRERANWRLLFLSAGEIGLAQHMQEAGKQARAGQELRLAEIPADAGAGLGAFENLHECSHGSDFSKAMESATRKHYGVALLAFLERLVGQQVAVVDTLRQGIKRFEAAFLTDSASGQARRVAHRFALVGAAGELATDWGLTGWAAGESLQAAGTCFKAWLANRGGEGNQEDRVMFDQVREFLRRYGESAFTDWDRPGNDTGKHAQVRSDRAGYRRHDPVKDEVEYFIFNEVFNTRVCKGFHAPAVGRVLLSRGAIKAGSEKGREWLVKEKLPAEGRARVVHVLPAIWGGDND